MDPMSSTSSYFNSQLESEIQPQQQLQSAIQVINSNQIHDSNDSPQSLPLQLAAHIISTHVSTISNNETTVDSLDQQQSVMISTITADKNELHTGHVADTGARTSEAGSTISLAPLTPESIFQTSAIENSGSTLRSRGTIAGLADSIPAAEMKKLQDEYEAPFKDLVNQNPIKIRDFKTAPFWFNDVPFCHNLRFSVVLIPSLVIILSWTGTTLLATLAIGFLLTYFTLMFSIPKYALLCCLFSVIAAEIVSFFSLLPLVWRSFLNIPLISFSYSFLIGLGGWALLQFPSLRVSEPALCILIEELMFVLIPPLMFFINIWASIFLFDTRYLGTITCIMMSLFIYLFYLPITSSYYRPGAAKFDVLVLTRPMTAVMITGSFFAPIVVETLSTIYLALTMDWELEIIWILWTISLQTFLLSLLGKARLFWFVSQSHGKLTFYMRIISGSFVVVIGSVLFARDALIVSWKFLFPALLLLALSLSLIAYNAEIKHRLQLSCVLLLAMYCILSYFLPWSIHYTSIAFLSLPLQVNLSLLTILAALSVLLLLRWRQPHPGLYILHSIGLVYCENWLLNEGGYPYWLLLGSSIAGVFVTDRLNSGNVIPRVTAWISAALHCSKLVWILPKSDDQLIYYDQISTIPSILPCMAISLLFLGAVRYDTEVVGVKRLSYAGLMFITLILGQYSLLLPIMSIVYPNGGTHTTAEILSTMLVLYSFFIAALLAKPDQTRGQHTRKLLAGLVVISGVSSAILNTFQPSLDFSELWIALKFISGVSYEGFPSSREREAILAISWNLVIDWLLFITTGIIGLLVLVSYLRNSIKNKPIFNVVFYILGWTIGLKFSLLMNPTIHFVIWQCYGVSGAITAILLYRAVVIPSRQRSSGVEGFLFSLLLLSFATQPLLNFFIDYRNFSPLRWTRFWLVSTFLIALGFKIKQQYKYSSLGGDDNASLIGVETTYYPTICNISCMIAFLSSAYFPPYPDRGISLLISSAIMELMQNDGIIMSSLRKENMLWPALAAFDAFLHVIALYGIATKLTIDWLSIIETIIIILTIPFHIRFITAYKSNVKLALVSCSILAVPLNLFLFHMYSNSAIFFLASLTCIYTIQIIFWNRQSVLLVLDD